jgi:hypothetical protein
MALWRACEKAAVSRSSLNGANCRGFVATVPVSGAERLAADPRVRIIEEDFRISVAGSSTLINHVETPEYWMCYDDVTDTYPTYPTYQGPCPGRYIGQDRLRGGEPIHFSATSNSSNAGMLFSPMSCP